MSTEQPSYYIKALWDPEAQVWISETDIPGLNIETDDLAEFERLIDDLAPEMLSDNLGIHGQDVIIHFTVADRRELRVA